MSAPAHVEPRTQRALILHRVRKMLEAKFGPQGTVDQFLRAVWRRPWQPGNAMRPAATVCDYGVARGEANNTDETKARVLQFHVVVDMADHWERQETVQDWTDRIEQIALAVQNYNAQCGMLRLDYLSDDPFTVMLEDGRSEAIWIIQFEAEYFVNVAAFA